MSNTPYYSFQLVPSVTDMTVREFREAVVGENGNFAKLDEFLAASDIISCVTEEVVGGYQKFVFTKKNGTVMEVQLPSDSTKADVAAVPNAASISGNVLQMIREDVDEDGSVTKEVLFSVVLPTGSESGDPVPGFSPVAVVEQTESGAVITITDINGTTTANITSGKDGSDGVSPTAKVEQTSTGAVITITDASGTTTAVITNGKDGANTGGEGSSSDGFSPIAVVENVENGVLITITDANGTTSAVVTNGKDGTDGDDGMSPSAKIEATEDGAVVTISDVDGTTTAVLKNGKDGTNGNDGVSPTVSFEETETGTIMTVSDENGTTAITILNGEDGHTPEKGVDYFTEEDKLSLVEAVLDSLESAEEVGF